MMLFSLGHLLSLLYTYTYLSLFILAGLEGPLVMLLAGYLVSRGVLSLSLAYLAVVAGDLLADFCYYALGRYGRGPRVTRWIARIGLTERRRNLLEKQFQVRGGRILLIGKAAHGIGGIILVAAGLAKMSFWRFAVFNLVATLGKSAFLLLIGYRFGRLIQIFNTALDIVAAVFVLLGVVALLFYLSIRQEKKILHEF